MLTTARRALGLLTHRIYTLPVLILAATARCDARCVMCDIWKGNAEARELAFGDLQHQLGALRRLGVRRLVLSGGEPLVHTRLWELCDALAEVGARMTLLTNGLRLARAAPEVARRFNEVIVSLDGRDSTHDAVRGLPGAYARLADGVAAVRANGPCVRITGRCTVQRRNHAEIARVIEAAHEIGLDGISFLAADVSTAAFNRPRRWDASRVADVALDAAQVATLERAVEELIADPGGDIASGFIAETPQGLRRLPRYYAALDHEADLPIVRCNAPWVSAVIEPNGDVRPCFFRHPMGNISDRPLDEILNSPEAIARRRDLDVRKDPTCRRCVCTLHLGPRARV